MRNFLSSRPFTLVGTVLLGSLLACAPAPMDKEKGGSNTGGSSSSSGSGGSSAQTGTGGGSGSGTGGGGSSPSGTGGSGSSSSGTGGSGSSSSGTGGSGSSSSGTGGSGSSPSGTGGAKADAGSGPADMGSTPAAPTFTDVYDKILKPGCTPCHDMVHKNIIFKDKAMALTSIKTVIMPGNVAGSKFFGIVEGPTKKMPPASSNKPALTADQVSQIKAWVMAGAKDD